MPEQENKGRVLKQGGVEREVKIIGGKVEADCRDIFLLVTGVSLWVLSSLHILFIAQQLDKEASW